MCGQRSPEQQWLERSIQMQSHRTESHCNFKRSISYFACHGLMVNMHIVYVAAGYYTNRLGVAYLMEQRRMSPTLNRKEFIRVAPHLKTKFIWPN